MLCKKSKLIFLTCIVTFIFTGCSSSPKFTSDSEITNREDKKEISAKDKTSEITDTRGSRRVLESTKAIASYYAHKFHGRQTANGEIYDMYALTAAHISYPFNTEVRVTNLTNNKNVVLRINDRKPDTNGRAIDISYRAAELLDMLTAGISQVYIEVLKWGEPIE